MKTIGLVSIRRDTAEFLTKQLDDFMAYNVKINTYILSEINVNKTLSDESLIIFVGKDAYEEASGKLNYICESIIANRSVNYNKIDAIFRIPPETVVYVLNDFKSSAIQGVNYFKELGINHVRYKALYPGADVDNNIKTIITFGEHEYIPAEMETVIDVGIRTLDISTILEILIRLDFPREEVGRFSLKYIRNIMDLTKTINNLNQHNEYMKNQLGTIINSVKDGIFFVDSNNRISTFNYAAERIFGCYGKDLIGESLSSLKIKMEGKFSYINSMVDSKKDIFEYSGKKLSVASNQIVLNDGNVERVFVINEVTEIQKLEQNIRMKLSRKRYIAQYSFDSIFGKSEIMKKQKEMAIRIASFDSPIYITGESGTGKELFAQAIHQSSSRSEGPFVAVNFAAMSENLIESELFGYTEGAFTGAKKGGAPGIFEQAHGGTLFLDEIGDAPLSFQIKLLRVLQEKQVRRIGDDKLIPVDVRVIVATHKNIPALIAEGKFREDLYYRINVLPLRLAPLRERKEDIEECAKYFYIEFATNIDGNVNFESFFEDVKADMLNYEYPGNMRQLRNIIEYLVYTSTNGKASKFALPADIQIGNGNDMENRKASLNLNDAELEKICLRRIRERNIEHRSAGRRSLANDLQCSEERIKKVIENFLSEGIVAVHKGRKGIVVTEKGIQRITEDIKTEIQ